MKPINVKVELEINNLRVYVNNVIHLSFNINNFVGVQSYFVGRKHFIDFHIKDTVIECEYTRKDLWEKILNELKKENYI